MNILRNLPGRPAIGLLTLLLLVLLLVVDASLSTPINPYAAPAPVALGSGQAPEGAHCTDM
ncbi:hypothetical protein ACXYTJ_06085 [Gilvimarinus sp. F26214L]|uniref:hypothetical protein n=1 Tax=Gilvimarinus sp. DZF01 TaxID=3461371 RepID=UPI0040462F85